MLGCYNWILWIESKTAACLCKIIWMVCAYGCVLSIEFPTRAPKGITVLRGVKRVSKKWHPHGMEQHRECKEEVNNTTLGGQGRPASWKEGRLRQVLRCQVSWGKARRNWPFIKGSANSQGSCTQFSMNGVERARSGRKRGVEAGETDWGWVRRLLFTMLGNLACVTLCKWVPSTFVSHWNMLTEFRNRHHIWPWRGQMDGRSGSGYQTAAGWRMNEKWQNRDGGCCLKKLIWFMKHLKFECH